MGLLDKMLAGAIPLADAPVRVLARVLLDEKGRVQSVELRQGCGNPETDERALLELSSMTFAPTRLGSKTSRRWHDIVWAPDVSRHRQKVR